MVSQILTFRLRIMTSHNILRVHSLMFMELTLGRFLVVNLDLDDKRLKIIMLVLTQSYPHFSPLEGVSRHSWDIFPLWVLRFKRSLLIA